MRTGEMARLLIASQLLDATTSHKANKLFHINTLKPKWNEWLWLCNIFDYILLKEMIVIYIAISLKIIPNNPTDN